MILTAPLALLLLGLGAIIWGTRIVLDNVVVVARYHRVSDFFVGVVVLSVGSDLPELVVSLDAAFRQLANQPTANLIVGNAIGSCFGQLGLVIGLAGVLAPLTLSRPQLLRHGSVLLVATCLLVLVGLDGLINRLEGLALVLGYVAYLVFVISEEGLTSRAHGSGSEPVAPGAQTRGGSVAPHWLRLIVGLAVVVFSAELIVRAAMTLAIQWGVDQSFIGIAIIGVGTSLPEVVISIAAVLRRRVGLTVGNLIGSNVLDTLLPIGLAATVVPLGFAGQLLRFDMPMLLGMTVLVLAFLWPSKGVRWPQAVVVLAAYLSYLVTITRAV